MIRVRASSRACLLPAGAAGLLAVVAVDASTLPGNLPLRREAEAAADGAAWWPALLVLALVAAAAYALWRRGALALNGWSKLAAPRGRPVRPTLVRVGSQALTPQASVHLVRFAGEELLVGCTSTQVTLLARRVVPAGEEAAP